jgi:hypothetical protein
MCDANSLLRNNIKREEPYPIFWASKNCSGDTMILKPGGHRDFNIERPTWWHSGRRIGRNDVHGFWLPPHIKMTTYNRPNYTGDVGTYFGNRDKGFYPDLENPRYYYTRNNIDSVKIERVRSWDEHLANCCTGRTSAGAMPDTCGQFWGKGADNSGVCDEFMQDYCSKEENKDKPECSCYAKGADPTDSDEMKLIKSNPKCFSALCNTHGYVPSNIRNTQCPSIKICKQEIATLGDSAILKENVHIQDCRDTEVHNTSLSTTTNDNRTTSPTPDGSYASNLAVSSTSSATIDDTFLYILLGFLAFIVLAFIGYKVFSSSQQNSRPMRRPMRRPRRYRETEMEDDF